jgi:hypothetical protein
MYEYFFDNFPYLLLCHDVRTYCYWLNLKGFNDKNLEEKICII